MKISELPLTTSVTGSEILPIVQGGTTKKVSISDALAGAGGVNPTSGYIPYNNAGTFADSLLATNGNRLRSVFGGSSEIGLNIDFNAQRYYVGDWDAYNNGNSIVIDDANNLLYTNCGGVNKGIYINPSQTSIGDTLNANTMLQIDTANNQLTTYTNGNNDRGLYFEFTNDLYRFGVLNEYELYIDNTNDIVKLGGNAAGLFKIEINGGSGYMKTYNNVGGFGFEINTNQVAKFGDTDNNKGFYYSNNITRVGDYLSNAGLFFDSQNKQMGLSSNDVTQEGFWFGNYDNTNRFCSIGFADSGYSYLLLNENDIRTYFNFNNYGLELKLSSFEFYFGGTSGNGAATFYVNNNINICQMGDVAGNNTSAAFGIDVNNETMLATTNLLTPTSSSSSGQHLKINVGGTDYVIELKNP